MPRIAEQRRLQWSPEQMFDLVADVRRYPEFLPWVVATRIKTDSETEMVADMLVGFNALREKFTSRVRKVAPDQAHNARIEVEYLDGPMKSLSNTWAFRPGEDGTGCVIDFNVDFTFRNALFEKLAGQYLDRAFRKMVAAFETRAAKLYGTEQPA
ncbi:MULTISPECIES: type II toxin-antitoxin system RatA family toxin [unclassified Novosphingobium]|uniref:type II toxin-antitoxin system RatA family toxin n=1 Tax=Novosphingobium TaxID=165696 RepID=UPI00144832FE|nr:MULTISPECIES: type II toxin-antitoxin system RatA family toxin [unclassified Novosphingobium]NKJ42002.1 coenzyme Q-binding protein COQ10 [Novosphingobium sp. SG720]NMN04391.1 coenzyme Q-binding protein COQ10 [Novosphingobium sp. SG919]NMN85618.1 coenzyme Q-binding protein COQ10 [Novosphingobium sp. SG916]